VRAFGRGTGARATVLRIPGIYAPDRPGGALERLRRGTPALAPEDDVFTSHIHACDLARACIAALWRGKPQRAVNVSDDSALKMADWFDLAADLHHLPRPPRIPLAQARQQLPPALLSFMHESRRLDNTRLKRELRLRLRYPTPHSGLLPV
jgi:nucleoside-diphosphate-sugar epimerase